MTTQVQLRRGTTAQNDSFTGAQGEVTVDITLNQLRVHDGSTPGGTVVGATADDATTTTKGVVVVPLAGGLGVSAGSLSISGPDLSVVTKDTSTTSGHSAATLQYSTYYTDGGTPSPAVNGNQALIIGSGGGGNGVVLYQSGFDTGLSLRGLPGGSYQESGIFGDWTITNSMFITSGGNTVFQIGPEFSRVDVFAIRPLTVEITTAGVQLKSKEGTNSLSGVATLVGGTVTVSNANITASSRIFLTGQNSSGTPGDLYVSARSNGVSFTITSTSGTDTRQVAYFIVEGF